MVATNMGTLALLRSTYESEADAQAAADNLIESRLAACARISPVRSVYRWKGAIERSNEWLLEAHVLPADVDGAWERLLDRHPYDTPLVECVGQSKVPARYMAWANRATNRP